MGNQEGVSGKASESGANVGRGLPLLVDFGFAVWYESITFCPMARS
jgi:hypothetical protein